MYEIVKLPCTIPTKIYGTNVHSIENLDFAFKGTEHELGNKLFSENGKMLCR